jgi:catechol 2,3-dioxygenase-like lactoylglutathione lyase family enzyme
VGPVIEVTLDAVDVERAVAFWRAALGYERLHDRYPYVVLGPPRGAAGPHVVIQKVERITADKTPVHLDLRVDDRGAEVVRLVSLGATVRWEVDDTAVGGEHWTTLADPQGTLFCIAPARKSW